MLWSNIFHQIPLLCIPARECAYNNISIDWQVIMENQAHQMTASFSKKGRGSFWDILRSFNMVPDVSAGFGQFSEAIASAAELAAASSRWVDVEECYYGLAGCWNTGWDLLEHTVLVDLWGKVCSTGFILCRGLFCLQPFGSTERQSRLNIKTKQELDRTGTDLTPPAWTRTREALQKNI